MHIGVFFSSICSMLSHPWKPVAWGSFCMLPPSYVKSED